MKNIMLATILLVSISGLNSMDDRTILEQMEDAELITSCLFAMGIAGDTYPSALPANCPLKPQHYMNPFWRDTSISDKEKGAEAARIAIALSELPWPSARLHIAAAAEYVDKRSVRNYWYYILQNNDVALAEFLFGKGKEKEPVNTERTQQWCESVRSVALARLLSQRITFAPQASFMQQLLTPEYEPGLIELYFPQNSAAITSVAPGFVLESLKHINGSSSGSSPKINLELLLKVRTLVRLGALNNQNNQTVLNSVQAQIDSLERFLEEARDFSGTAKEN